MKKELKLRIFIYGKNAINDIKYIVETLEPNFNEDIKYKVRPYVETDEETQWEYFIFQCEINEDANESIKNYLIDHYKLDNALKGNEEIKKIIQEHSNDENNDQLNKEISNVLLKYRKFYDVLVISVDNLLDEDSKSAFKYFQDLSKIRSQQPFILFLTKKDDNPKIINLFKFVTNEFFDKRNVFALKFPTNKKEIEIINNFFIKCANYYHEVGNLSINSSTHSFNILICGQAGVGKSSFINQFLKEKAAKEGEGLSVTHEITNYMHPIYPIKIFDTPGFESDDTVKMVKKTVIKFEKDILISKGHLDLILYFNELKLRNFLNLEIDLLKYLLKKNKRIIFVLNDFKHSKKSDIQKMTDTMKDSLTKIIKSIPEEDQKKININDILNNIIIINLKQSIIEFEDENGDNKSIIKQCYGMNDLFKKIYDMFLLKKISIHEIQNSKDVKQLQINVSKYELLQNLKNIEDAYIPILIDSSKKILSYSKYDCFMFIFRDYRRKKLLEEINRLNNGAEIKNIDKKFSDFSSQINDMKKPERKKIIKEFFESIKQFEGPFKTEGFDFDAYWYNEDTLLYGALLLKELEIDCGHYDDKFKNFIKQLSTSLNSAIDGFIKLSEEWRDTYESLKKHKSEEDWVNRYFIINLPKNE